MCRQFVADARQNRTQKAEVAAITRTIDTLLINDQRYRWMSQFGTTDLRELDSFRGLTTGAQLDRMRDVVARKVGLPQAVFDSLWALQDKLDELNFAVISALIKEKGFPKGRSLSYRVATLLQHSAQRIDPQFMMLLFAEFKAGHLPPMEYAVIYDNVQLAHNKPAIYCVDGRKPVDTTATNIARQEIGLDTYK